MYQRSKELGAAASSAPGRVQDLTRRTLEEHDLTQMEAGEVVKKFVRMSDRYLTTVDECSTTDLVCILHDAIDHVAERRRPVGPTQQPSRSSAAASGSSAAASQPQGSSRAQQVGYAAVRRNPKPAMDGNEYPEAERNSHLSIR